MELQPLDPRLLALLIKDEEDVLTSRAEKRRNAIEFNPCPRCGSKMQEALTEGQVFTDGEVLPRTVGKCSNCDYTYDPYSGIILSTGDMAKRAEDPYALNLEED